jgi:hypothetical protein
MTTTSHGATLNCSKGRCHMSGTGRYSTHHIPDEGIWYAPGETVRVDQSSGQAQIVKDPHGDHDVHGCRQATEYTDGVPLLRIDLRKRDATAGQPSVIVAPYLSGHQAVDGDRPGQEAAASARLPWLNPPRQYVRASHRVRRSSTPPLGDVTDPSNQPGTGGKSVLARPREESVVQK